MKKIIMVVAMATLVMVSCQDTATNVTSTSTVDSTMVMKADSTNCVDSCAKVVNTKDSSKTQK